MNRKTTSRRRVPRPANVIGTVALIAALAGTATALPGKGTVDRGDLKRNAVRSKAIKNGQVKAKDLKGPGKWRVVGTKGAPAFADGGEGDCVWQSGSPIIAGTESVAFRFDAVGRVQLRGLATFEDGPGGDGNCDPNDPGEREDARVFTLPVKYRPTGLDLSGLAQGFALIGHNGGTIADERMPAGMVYGATEYVAFDGTTYDAGKPASGGTVGTAPAVSRAALRELLAR